MFFVFHRDAEAAVRRIDGMPFGFRRQKLIARLGSSRSGDSSDDRRDRSTSEAKGVCADKKSGSTSRYSRRHYIWETKRGPSDSFEGRQVERDASSNYRHTDDDRQRYVRADVSPSKERFKDKVSPRSYESPECHYKRDRASFGREGRLDEVGKCRRPTTAGAPRREASSRSFDDERWRRSKERGRSRRYESRGDAYRREERGSRPSFAVKEKVSERSRYDSTCHPNMDREGEFYRGRLQRGAASRSSSMKGQYSKHNFEYRRGDRSDQRGGRSPRSKYSRLTGDVHLASRPSRQLHKSERHRDSVISRSGSRVRQRDFSVAGAGYRSERSYERQRSAGRRRSCSSDGFSGRESRLHVSEVKEPLLRAGSRRSASRGEPDVSRAKRRTSIDTEDPNWEGLSRRRRSGVDRKSSHSFSRGRGRSLRDASVREFVAGSRRRSLSPGGRESPTRGHGRRSDSEGRSRTGSCTRRPPYNRDRRRGSDVDRFERRARDSTLKFDGREQRPRSSSFDAKKRVGRSRSRGRAVIEPRDPARHKASPRVEEKQELQKQRQLSCSPSVGRRSCDRRCSRSQRASEEDKKAAESEALKCEASVDPSCVPPTRSPCRNEGSTLVEDTQASDDLNAISPQVRAVEASVGASSAPEEATRPRVKNKWKSRWGVVPAAAAEDTSAEIGNAVPAGDSTAPPELPGEDGAAVETAGVDGTQTSPPGGASSGAATAGAFSVALRGSSAGGPFPSTKAKPDSTDQRAVEKFLGSLEAKPKIKIRIGLKSNGQIQQQGQKGDIVDSTSKMDQGTSAAALAAAYLQASGGCADDVEPCVFSVNESVMEDAPVPSPVDQSMDTDERRDCSKSNSLDEERDAKDATGCITATEGTSEVQTSSSVKKCLPVGELSINTDNEDVSMSAEEREQQRVSQTPSSRRANSPERPAKVGEDSSDTAEPCLAQSSVADDAADSSNIFARRKLAREGPSQRRRYLSPRRSQSVYGRPERAHTEDRAKTQLRRSRSEDRGLGKVCGREQDRCQKDVKAGSSRKEFRSPEREGSRGWVRHRRISKSMTRGASVRSEVRADSEKRRTPSGDAPTRGSHKTRSDRESSAHRERGGSKETASRCRWGSSVDGKFRSKSPVGFKSYVHDSPSPGAPRLKRSRSRSRRVDSLSPRARWNSSRSGRSSRNANRGTRRVGRAYNSAFSVERADSLGRLTRSPSRRQGGSGYRDRSFSRPSVSRRARETPRGSVRKCVSRCRSLSGCSRVRSPVSRTRMATTYSKGGRAHASSPYNRLHVRDAVVGCSSEKKRRVERRYLPLSSSFRAREDEKRGRYSSRHASICDREASRDNSKSRRGGKPSEQQGKVYYASSRSPSRPYRSRVPGCEGAVISRLKRRSRSYGSASGRSRERRRGCSPSTSEGRHDRRQSSPRRRREHNKCSSSVYEDKTFSRYSGSHVRYGGREAASRQEVRSISVESKPKRDTRTGNDRSLSKSSREPYGEGSREYRCGR